MTLARPAAHAGRPRGVGLEKRGSLEKLEKVRSGALDAKKRPQTLAKSDVKTLRLGKRGPDPLIGQTVDQIKAQRATGKEIILFPTRLSPELAQRVVSSLYKRARSLFYKDPNQIVVLPMLGASAESIAQTLEQAKVRAGTPWPLPGDHEPPAQAKPAVDYVYILGQREALETLGPEAGTTWDELERELALTNATLSAREPYPQFVMDGEFLPPTFVNKPYKRPDGVGRLAEGVKDPLLLGKKNNGIQGPIDPPRVAKIVPVTRSATQSGFGKLVDPKTANAHDRQFDEYQFLGEDGKLLARVAADHVHVLLEERRLDRAQYKSDLEALQDKFIGLSPVKVFSTSNLHFIKPELVQEVLAFKEREEQSILKARKARHDAAKAAGASDAEAKKQADDMLVIYASTFISGGRPEDGAINVDIARWVSEEVLKPEANARAIFGTDNVYIINPAAAEASLSHAESGDDFMWAWSEFLTGDVAKGIEHSHFIGPRLVRAYFDAHRTYYEKFFREHKDENGKPDPRDFKTEIARWFENRGLWNSGGMRQEFNLLNLINNKRGIGKNMIAAYYDGVPLPAWAHQYIRPLTFAKVVGGWHHTNKAVRVEPGASEPEAVDRLLGYIQQERYGSQGFAKVMPSTGARERERRALAQAYDVLAKMAAGPDHLPSPVEQKALDRVHYEAQELLGPVDATPWGMKDKLERALAATRLDRHGNLAEGGIDPAYALNVWRVQKLGKALGLPTAVAKLQEAARVEIRVRTARILAQKDRGPIDYDDVLRVMLLAQTHQLGENEDVAKVQALLKAGAPHGVQVRLESGEHWIETHGSLLAKLVTQTLMLQRALDQAATDGRARFYLSVPISAGDMKRNKQIAMLAKDWLLRQAPEFLGLESDGVFILNPAEFQALSPEEEKVLMDDGRLGNWYMAQWQKTLRGNARHGGNFEGVNFLGNDWQTLLWKVAEVLQPYIEEPIAKLRTRYGWALREIQRRGLSTPHDYSGDYGGLESKGMRDEARMFERNNAEGTHIMRMLEDGGLLPAAVMQARIKGTTYQKMGLK